MDKNKKAGGIFGIAAIVAISALVLATGVASAVDRYVGPGETYTTIQSAENVAVSYDTIIVRDGIYSENVDVDVAHLNDSF